MSKGTIKFHDVNDASYGCFSTKSPHAVTVRHVQYPSVDHYLQCERFKGTPVEEDLRSAASVWEVDKLVRKGENSGLQRDDWDKIKTDVMLLGVYAKFSQNPDAQNVLIQTGNKPLVYHDQNDAFWGDGGSDSGSSAGRNVLGVILMAVRKRLVSDRARKKEERPAAGGNSISAAAAASGGGGQQQRRK